MSDNEEQNSSREFAGYEHAIDDQVANLNVLAVNLLNRCTEQRNQTSRISELVERMNLPGITKKVEQCKQNVETIQTESITQYNTLQQMSIQIDQIEQTVQQIYDSVSQMDIDIISIRSGLDADQSGGSVQQ